MLIKSICLLQQTSLVFDYVLTIVSACFMQKNIYKIHAECMKHTRCNFKNNDASIQDTKCMQHVSIIRYILYHITCYFTKQIQNINKTDTEQIHENKT